jgi:hypothetical protein
MKTSPFTCSILTVLKNSDPPALSFEVFGMVIPFISGSPLDNQ